MIKFRPTDATEELDTEGGEYEEQQEEEQAKVSHFGQSLDDGVEERPNGLRHLEQLKNCKKRK